MHTLNINYQLAAQTKAFSSTQCHAYQVQQVLTLTTFSRGRGSGLSPKAIKAKKQARRRPTHLPRLSIVRDTQLPQWAHAHTTSLDLSGASLLKTEGVMIGSLLAQYIRILHHNSHTSYIHTSYIIHHTSSYIIHHTSYSRYINWFSRPARPCAERGELIP